MSEEKKELAKDRPRQISVEAIRGGTVIDHIPADRALLVVELVTDETDELLVGVNLPSTTLGKKGLLKIRHRKLSDHQMQVLATLAPEATVNIIEDYEIVEKITLTEPEEVVNLFRCNNQNCITNHQPVASRFHRADGDGYCCHYCERTFSVQRLTIRRPS